MLSEKNQRIVTVSPPVTIYRPRSLRFWPAKFCSIVAPGPHDPEGVVTELGGWLVTANRDLVRRKLEAIHNVEAETCLRKFVLRWSACLAAIWSSSRIGSAPAISIVVQSRGDSAAPGGERCTSRSCPTVVVSRLTQQCWHLDGTFGSLQVRGSACNGPITTKKAKVGYGAKHQRTVRRTATEASRTVGIGSQHL
jgi:hypothetical protein